MVYMGAGTAADLNNHANQMNPNNWRYWAVRTGNPVIDVPANVVLAPVWLGLAAVQCCCCIVGTVFCVFLGTLCVVFLSIALMVAAGGLWYLAVEYIQYIKLYSPILPGVLLWLVPLTLALFGLLSCATSLCGCAGICRPQCGFFFAVSLFIMFVALIVAVVGILSYKEEILVTGKEKLWEEMKRFSGNNTDTDKLVNFFQQKIGCCGVSNYSDWINTPWANGVRNQTVNSSVITTEDSISVVPPSCCITEGTCGNSSAIDVDLVTMNLIFPKGCVVKIADWVERHSTLITWSTVGVCIVLVFGIISACLHTFGSGD